LAEVLELGQHQRIERPDSRRAVLFEGDEILIAYGARYAPDQFESRVPDGLEPTDLAAAGGVAGDVVATHFDLDEPTRIKPIGLLADDDGVVTLRRCAPRGLTEPDDLLRRLGSRPPVIAVFGTSMNSGKTTTAAAIVRGLTTAGYTVGAGKVTGTGAGGDPRLFQDSGAMEVLDFTDFGFVSTYGLPHHDIRALLASLVTELAAGPADVVVLEVADGLFQQETARLVDDPLLATLVDTVVFAAGEAMGALAGRDTLQAKGLRLVAASGRMTASPLAKREAVQALDVPVLDVDELASGDAAELLLGRRSGAERPEVESHG